MMYAAFLTPFEIEVPPDIVCFGIFFMKHDKFYS